MGCALILGGVDITGPQLYQIHPHGSTDCLPFTAMGSGSLAAMAVLESEYRDDLTIEQGKDLVKRAISAGTSMLALFNTLPRLLRPLIYSVFNFPRAPLGVINDLGSGGNVDVTVITKDTAVKTRAYDTPCPRLFRSVQPYTYPSGTTPLLGQMQVS